jgi:hypothetical protein
MLLLTPWPDPAAAPRRRLPHALYSRREKKQDPRPKQAQLPVDSSSKLLNF